MAESRVQRSHNCMSSLFQQVSLEARQVLSTHKNASPDELQQRCPYCKQVYGDPPKSDAHGCRCGKVLVKLSCGHLTHWDCYLTSRECDSKACAHCGVIPLEKPTSSDLKKQEQKKQAVPDIVPALTFHTLLRGVETMENVPSDTRLSVLMTKAEEWFKSSFRSEIRFVILNQAGDKDKTLRDYPGVHLAGIHVLERFT